MKKRVTLAALLIASISLNAQFGKNLETKMNGTAVDAVNVLPKGFELYSTVHTDPIGISGVYYAKYPIQLIYKNTMNACKTFAVDQLTIEFIPETHSGRFHFVNDEVGNMVRNTTTDLTKEIDFYANGAQNLGAAVAKKYGYYAFGILCKSFNFGSVLGIAKKSAFIDGMVYRSTEDPDVLLVGKVYKDRTIAAIDKEYSLGGNFNVLCKNKEKLAEWDSTRIVNALFDNADLYRDYASSAFGDMVEMPKMALNDDVREADYYKIIMPKATEDKPIAWGTLFSYCYINTDWKVVTDAGGTPTHRWCTVVAVSNGWTTGSEARYIPVIIKENYDGTKYGTPYFGGFKGALVPISSDTATKFAH